MLMRVTLCPGVFWQVFVRLFYDRFHSFQRYKLFTINAKVSERESISTKNNLKTNFRVLYCLILLKPVCIVVL